MCVSALKGVHAAGHVSDSTQLPPWLGTSDTETGQILALILRLNDAPAKEHKKDVGERTSIRLFFPESALPNPLENNDNNTLMVFVTFKPLDFL